MQNNKTVFIAMPSCNNSVAINFSQSQNISYVAPRFQVVCSQGI